MLYTYIYFIFPHNQNIYQLIQNKLKNLQIIICLLLKSNDNITLLLLFNELMTQVVA